MAPLTLADADLEVQKFAAHAKATKRVKDTHGLGLAPGLPQPPGKLDTLKASTVLVTTSEELQDPLTDELAEAYTEEGTSFVYVGPLLAASSTNTRAPKQSIVEKVVEARAAGRPVVLVSMGTLLTSEDKLFGWDGRSGCPSGARSLNGRELCQAVWAGAFDALGVAEGTDLENPGVKVPLLLVSMGGHLELLGGLKVPENAVCQAFLPQVDLLLAGIDVFLTHGGQNSFTEAMAHKTPLVVVPGFGDQHANARKAVRLGVGLKVDRPECAEGEEVAVAAAYRKVVRDTLREALARADELRGGAARICEGLKHCGGVSLAVQTILNAGPRDGAASSAVP